MCLSNGIPTIVLTGRMDEELQEKLIAKGVVDYVLKDNRYSYQYAVNAILNLKKNASTRVLVAEDSKPIRKYITQILKMHLFQTFEAQDGVDALETLKNNPDIELLITDFHMPNIDGFELIRQARTNFESRRLAILGLSSLDADNISTKFIKTGADDYLPKPFKIEEFNCRIDRILESQRLVAQMERLAYEDTLTGLHNSRFFFKEGQKIYDSAQNSGQEIFSAVMDLDHFKQINDTYGHNAGDMVLAHFGSRIKEFFSKFLVVRTGGEEFFAVFKGWSAEKTFKLLDSFRQVIESDMVLCGEQQISVTISIGLTNETGESLDEFIHNADALLYRAKDSGRNIVISDCD